MLLSIGMIVKNEERYLRDCLEGLKPILDQVESELIICDTGSTDATVEIAKDFTEKVFEIGWRDDFAWARDQNLKRARGRWYMYIDADEIMEDASEIIAFFNSGEYKKFASASFQMKNFIGKGDTYSMFNAMRLYRIDKDTRWYGKIHEHISPVKEPAMNFDTMVLHYGYVYEDDFARQNKANRNLKPMMEQYESHPKDIRNIAHLVQHYHGFGKPEEAKEYIDAGLALYKKNTKNIFWHVLYQQLVANHFTGGKWDEVVETVRDYFDFTVEIFANAYVLKYMEFVALSNLKRYGEAAEAAVETIEYVAKKDNGELDTYILSCTTVVDLKNEDIITAITTNYNLAGDFDKTYEWLDKFDKNDPRRDADVYSIFAGYAYVEDISAMPKLYDYVVNKHGIGSKDYNEVLSIIENNMQNAKQKFDVAAALIDGREDFGDGYIRLQHLRYLDYQNDAAAADALGYFEIANVSFSQHFGDIVVAGIKYRRNLDAMIQKIHVTNAVEFMVNTLRTTDGFAEMLLEYLEETRFIETCDSIKPMRIISGILSILTEIEPIMAKAAKVENDKQAPLFEAYSRLRSKYLSMVYKKEVYCEEMISHLPEQDGFAFYLGKAFECKDANDKTGYVQSLRQALKILPSMKDLVVLLGEELKKEESAPTVHDQLAQETGRLKTIIYTMINTGNMGQAEQILESYKEVNPTDPEIQKISDLIEAGSV